MVNDAFYNAGTHIRNVQLRHSVFFCFSKRKRAGGFRFSPGPLEPTRKTVSVFLDFSRDNKNSFEIWKTAKPMRIRTALQISNARRFYRNHSNAAACKFGVPQQAARTIAPVGWLGVFATTINQGLPELYPQHAPNRNQRPFSPPSFPVRRKRRGRRRLNQPAGTGQLPNNRTRRPKLQTPRSFFIHPGIGTAPG